ncbi:MAG: HAD family hydrolase [Spirochaetota bacterium]
MNHYVAFYDLDMTILSASSGKLFIRYLYKKGLISSLDLITGIYVSLMHRIGFIHSDAIIRKWVARFSGWSEESMETMSRDWYVHMVKPTIRDDAAKSIQWHNSNGAKTVILSAATRFICEPVQDTLHMDDIICTELDIRKGLFTGEITGEYNHGEEKLKRALDYCNANGYDLRSSYYYADSISDLPVLEKVQHPICVTPDRLLRKTAKQRGWKILDW